MSGKRNYVCAKTSDAQQILCPHCQFVFFVKNGDAIAKVLWYRAFGFEENITFVSVVCPNSHCKKELFYESRDKNKIDWAKIARCQFCGVYNIIQASYAELGELYRENKEFMAECLHCGRIYTKNLRCEDCRDRYEKIADIFG